MSEAFYETPVNVLQLFENGQQLIMEMYSTKADEKYALSLLEKYD